MVNISYSLTQDDLKHLEAERRGGVFRRIFRVAGGALLGGLGIIVLWQALFLFPWNRPSGNLMIAGMGLFFLWIALEFPGMRWISRRLADPFAASQVQVQEEKLVYSRAGKTKQFRWMPKRDFSESEMFFFLRDFHSEIRLAIPKRVLTEEQEKKLRDLAARNSAEAADGGEEIECRFVLTQEELDESAAANHRVLGPRYGKILRRVACGLGAALIALAPQLIGRSWAQEVHTEPGLAACAVALGLFYVWAATGCVGLKKLSRMDRERLMKVNNSAIAVSCANKTKTYKWMRFTAYQETPGLFLLRTSNVEFWTIPKRAVTPADQERLRSILDRKLPQR